MAVTYFTGFESAAAGLDDITLVGGAPAVYSTTQARTGTHSIRCNAGSSQSSYLTIPATPGWLHFGLYIATMPTSARMIARVDSTYSLAIESSGKLSFNGLGTTVLTTGTWYWVGLRRQTGAFNGVWVTLDGVDEKSGNISPGSLVSHLGLVNLATAACDIYIDDVIIDSAGFIAPSKVTDLLPTANSAVGTGWTLGSGGTTGQWDAVNNQPPAAVADAGTTNQIRNATSNANSHYDATLRTYTVGGVGGSDTVIAVQNVIATAAPVTTSAKQGLVGNVSNPAITTIALGAGGTAGAFWSGLAGGTYPTGWKASLGTLTTSPSVTLGTAPVMRVTQVTASTRIAMVAYMALRVAWTPGGPTTHEAAAAVTANGVITAAGGTAYRAAASTISATATITAADAEVFTPGVTHEAAATIAATATIAGDGVRVAGVTAAVSAAATVSPAPTGSLAGAASIVTAASVTGGATASRAAATTVTAQATTTAGATRYQQLAATMSAQATVSAAAVLHQAAATAVSALASVDANATIIGAAIIHAASAAVTATAAVTAAAGVLQGAAAAAAASATTSGVATRYQHVGAVAGGLAAASAAVEAQLGIAVEVQGQALLAGNVTAYWAAQAAIEGVATAFLELLGATLPPTAAAGIAVRPGAQASVVPRPPEADLGMPPGPVAVMASPAPLAGGVLSSASGGTAVVVVRPVPDIEVVP